MISTSVSQCAVTSTPMNQREETFTSVSQREVTFTSVSQSEVNITSVSQGAVILSIQLYKVNWLVIHVISQVLISPMLISQRGNNEQTK